MVELDYIIGTSPINIVSDEVTQGGTTGFLNMTLGDLGEFGIFQPLLTDNIKSSSRYDNTKSRGAMSISSTAPIKIGSGKSLKSCFDDLIDEISNITVPTGSEIVATPINRSQLQLLKTKIMDLQFEVLCHLIYLE